MTGRGLARLLLSLAALTLAARLVGFGRSLVFSKTVGDTCLGDVYNAANQLPNVLFEVVAGGVLAGVVVPVVTRHLAADRRAQADRTASALVTWTLLVLTPAGLLALLGARAYGGLVGGGPACAGSAETVAALLVMFVPQVWLYGLAVLSAGLLQACSRFVAAALAPLLSSVVVIAAYLAFGALAPVGATSAPATLTRTALATLGWGTTAGVLVLALTTVLPLARSGLRLRPTLRFAPGDRRVVVGIAAAGLAGLLLQQASVLAVIWVVQRSGDPGGLTRYTWAAALYLLPYAVLAAPLLQLAFPRLAAAAGQGVDEVRRVLARTAPGLAAAACLGAALLVATAVPVARVFVLGPGSGRTLALAVPIAAFAPAVIGFALLGLASRALLALHRARAGGLATAAAWGTVTAWTLLLPLVVPAGWLVPGLAAGVSVGMLLGAGVGWGLLARAAPASPAGSLPLGLAGALAAALPAAGVAGAAGGGLSWSLADASLPAAAAGAVGVAALGTVLFVAVLAVLRPSLLRQLRQLRRPAGTSD